MDDRPQGRGPGSYKRYLQEDVPIPTSTKYYRRKMDDEINEAQDGIAFRNENASDTDESMIDIDDDQQSISSSLSSIGDSLCSDAGLLTDEDQYVTSDQSSCEKISSSDDDGSAAGDDLGNDDHVDNLNEDEEEVENGGMPLYEGCRITRQQSEIILMSFCVRYQLPEVALTDLLDIINCHTPMHVHGSKYLFLKTFNDVNRVSTNKRFYCIECTNSLYNDNDELMLQCTNERCLHENHLEDLIDKGSYFSYIGIRSQLETVFKNREVRASFRKNNHMTDVTSGQLYCNLLEEEKIQECDITLQMNTDGAQLHNSSKRSMWPLQEIINELPPQIRRKHIVLVALWYSKIKPNMATFMEPFINELEDLKINGIVRKDENDQDITSRVYCVISSVDSVARPLLQNIKQFNGSFGCSFCLKEGARVAGEGRGFSRVYCGEVCELRTEQQHLRDGQLAIEENNAVNGVKGVPSLMLLPCFNIIDGFVPDYMHSVLLGVVRWFVTQWFDSSNSAQHWYLGGHVNAINNVLTCIKPPSEVTRAPRSLDERKLWKASEWRSFLLYYSMPCLKEYLPRAYLKHWLLLVTGIYLLLQEQVGDHHKHTAARALKKFVLKTEILYGARFCTFNLHLLLHLPKSVDNWGALWATSTFVFEYYNGVLAKLFCGTQYVPEQICKMYQRIKLLNLAIGQPGFQNNEAVNSLLAKSLLKKLAGDYVLTKNALRDGMLVCLGAPKQMLLTVPQQICVERVLDFNVVEAPYYDRFLYNGVKYHSLGYSKLKVRHNCTVRLRNGALVEITKVINALNPDRSYTFVILGELLTTVNEDICRDYELNISSSSVVKRVVTNNTCVAFLPQDIECKCVKIDINDESYTVPLVNSVERD